MAELLAAPTWAAYAAACGPIPAKLAKSRELKALQDHLEQQSRRHAPEMAAQKAEARARKMVERAVAECPAAVQLRESAAAAGVEAVEAAAGWLCQSDHRPVRATVVLAGGNQLVVASHNVQELVADGAARLLSVVNPSDRTAGSSTRFTRACRCRA